jgi:hypothetical protein
MWPSLGRKSSSPSSELEPTIGARFRKVPNSQGSFLVITRVQRVDQLSGEVLEEYVDVSVER